MLFLPHNRLTCGTPSAKPHQVLWETWQSLASPNNEAVLVGWMIKYIKSLKNPTKLKGSKVHRKGSKVHRKGSKVHRKGLLDIYKLKWLIYQVAVTNREGHPIPSRPQSLQATIPQKCWIMLIISQAKRCILYLSTYKNVLIDIHIHIHVIASVLRDASKLLPPCSTEDSS